MHAKSTQTARNPKPLWQEFETASVDLYRLGAITACALGTVQRCHARRSLATETLRRLCHRALVHGERTPEDGGREEEEGGGPLQECRYRRVVFAFEHQGGAVERHKIEMFP